MFSGSFVGYLDIESTLHALAKEGTGLLLQRMINPVNATVHCNLRILIRASPRLFDPEFVSVLWRLTSHIDQVGILCDIITVLLDAVVLLIVHDVESGAGGRLGCCH
jgi:hypothetical protein